MRLKPGSGGAGPKTALALLGRIQKHRATNRERACTAISRTTPEQLDTFAALSVSKPQVRLVASILLVAHQSVTRLTAKLDDLTGSTRSRKPGSALRTAEPYEFAPASFNP